MKFPKYDGNIHPNEWTKQIQICCFLKKIIKDDDILQIAKTMIDPIIINNNNILENNNITSLEELKNLLKQQNSFLIFKNSTLKHIATGKYLSCFNKKYQNSNYNLVYCGDTILNNNALWIISNNNITNLITCQNSITLKHKSSSNNYLSVDSNYKVKMKDNVLLKISFGKNTNVKNLTLRSHENILKIDNNDYQEVFAHENRIGGIDEWCIEFIE
ncbi:hypothetical protein C1646_819609 [Rhizophagus diaphanus]|nr:hypothetical protein C1646_819609 [Rhizophagus diaphanus] [Rhizophagus sp. MUCL 43196]